MASYDDIIKNFSGALDTEEDNRERSANSDHFLNAENGQWEPSVWEKTANRPRFTFDRMNPYVDDIMGDIEQSSFGINVKPAGGRSDKDTALLYEGLFRNTENLSKAKFTYNMAARAMVSTGVGGWEIVHDYVNTSCFDKDLLISPLFNFYNSIWFDPGHVKPTASDANWCVKIISMTKDDYEEDYPDGHGLSVGVNDYNQVYYYKRPDEVILGKYYFKKSKKVKLAKMSNQAVFIVDEDFMMILDELNKFNIQVKAVRETWIDEVFTQTFDGSDILEDEEYTPFKLLPIVPVYGNFSVSEHKLLYRSAVERLMDPQRGLNYSESRKIEEGALAPRAKLMMTQEQAEGHTASLSTMNTNADPVQFYNHIGEQPVPFPLQGSQINAGLAEIAQSMDSHINRTSGKIQADRDRGLGVQSGVALQKLDDKETSSNYKYTQAMEIAISHTCTVMMGAMPEVYSSLDQVQTEGQDGAKEVVTLNEVIQDEQTGEIIETNNLKKGTYSVVCTAGPNFTTQQQKTVSVIGELAQADPTIMEISGDILLNNITSPGMDLIAARKRAIMVKQGVIPEEQLTDEEKAKIQAEQQNAQQNMSPMDQANLMIAQAEAEKAQAQTAEAQSKAQERGSSAQIKVGELQHKQRLAQIQLAEAQMKLRQEQERNDMEKLKLPHDIKNIDANTLKLLKESMGVDTITGPGVQRAYSNTVRQINGSLLDATIPGNGGRMAMNG